MPTESIPIITIRDAHSGSDFLAFRALNEEWINSQFTLEQADRDTLGDPHGKILARGGRILMACADGEPVGTVALIPGPGNTFELSKMAVSPQMRGLGLGRRLILHTIAVARELGATSLFLGSSTKLQSAVHLYESVGFRHVEPSTLPIHYVRANVFMQLVLTPEA